MATGTKEVLFSTKVLVFRDVRTIPLTEELSCWAKTVAMQPKSASSLRDIVVDEAMDCSLFSEMCKEIAIVEW